MKLADIQALQLFAETQNRTRMLTQQAQDSSLRAMELEAQLADQAMRHKLAPKQLEADIMFKRLNSLLEGTRVAQEGQRVGLEKERVGLQGRQVDLEEQRVSLEEQRLGLEGERVGLERERVAQGLESLKIQREQVEGQLADNARRTDLLFLQRGDQISQFDASIEFDREKWEEGVRQWNLDFEEDKRLRNAQIDSMIATTDKLRTETEELRAAAIRAALKFPLEMAGLARDGITADYEGAMTALAAANAATMEAAHLGEQAAARLAGAITGNDPATGENTGRGFFMPKKPGDDGRPKWDIGEGYQRIVLSAVNRAGDDGRAGVSWMTQTVKGAASEAVGTLLRQGAYGRGITPEDRQTAIGAAADHAWYATIAGAASREKTPEVRALGNQLLKAISDGKPNSEINAIYIKLEPYIGAESKPEKGFFFSSAPFTGRKYVGDQGRSGARVATDDGGAISARAYFTDWFKERAGNVVSGYIDDYAGIYGANVNRQQQMQLAENHRKGLAGLQALGVTPAQMYQNTAPDFIGPRR